MVYRASTHSPDGSLNGYLNFTLAYFNTSQWNNTAPRFSTINTTICRYPDFREPPDSPNKYARTITFYHILAARLAFVVVFENFVALVMIIVRWCIPDIPVDLRDQIRREAYITNEIIIKQETLRATGARQRKMSLDESNIALAKIEQIMDPKLSSSQLDLVMHGPGNPIAPGHCQPSRYQGVTESFLDIETGRRTKNIEDDIVAPVSL